jgi:hypothetical protein
LDKIYEIGLVKLDGTIEINNKININYTNNKFYYFVNRVNQNNNSVNKANVIDIPGGKYDFNKIIMKINGLLKKDKGFFKASLENGKVVIEITKSAYSIDFSKQNKLVNIFGFDSKILIHGKHISENNFNQNAINNIFIWCNLIDDSYIDSRKINSMYKLKLIMMK